jgi:hypothetical protein
MRQKAVGDITGICDVDHNMAQEFEGTETQNAGAVQKETV